jgi:hypothetical protein
VLSVFFGLAIINVKTYTQFIHFCSVLIHPIEFIIFKLTTWWILHSIQTEPSIYALVDSKSVTKKYAGLVTTVSKKYNCFVFYSCNS